MAFCTSSSSSKWQSPLSHHVHIQLLSSQTLFLVLTNHFWGICASQGCRLCSLPHNPVSPIPWQCVIPLFPVGRRLLQLAQARGKLVLLISQSQWLLPLVFLAAGLWLPSLSPGMGSFKTTFPQGFSSHRRRETLPCFSSLTLGVVFEPRSCVGSSGAPQSCLGKGSGQEAKAGSRGTRGSRWSCGVGGGDGSSIPLTSAGGREKLQPRCGWDVRGS